MFFDVQATSFVDFAVSIRVVEEKQSEKQKNEKQRREREENWDGIVDSWYAPVVWTCMDHGFIVLVISLGTWLICHGEWHDPTSGCSWWICGMSTAGWICKPIWNRCTTISCGLRTQVTQPQHPSHYLHDLTRWNWLYNIPNFGLIQSTFKSNTGPFPSLPLFNSWLVAVKNLNYCISFCWFSICFFVLFG